MKKYKIRIEGTSPLLCNRFTQEAAEKATKGATVITAAGGKGTPQEQCEPKLYHDGLDGESGNPCIPQPNLLRCIIDAGKYFKAGRSKITTQKSSLIPSCVGIDGVTIPIITNEGWVPYTTPVRIPATGGRILCHRPMFNDWALEFVAELDDEIISHDLFREIVDAAGRRIGLGDFRPDCKGPFGKFVVVSWEEIASL